MSTRTESVQSCPTMAALDNLSERDKAVLRSIFDPTATIAAEVVEDAGDKFFEDEEGKKC